MASPDDSERRPTALWRDALGRTGIRSAQILLVLLVAVAIVIALINLLLVVVPLLIALIIASALAPVVGWLRKHGVPRAAAAGLLLLGTVLFVSGLIALIVVMVQNQWSQLAQSVSEGLGQLQSFLQNGPLPIDAGQLDQLREQFQSFLTSGSLGSLALSGVMTVGHVAAGAVLTVVILFFFLEDGDRMWNFLIQKFRGDDRERAHRIGRSAVAVLGGYLRGTVVIAAVDAVGIGIGLVVLQVPLAIPLAVVVFLTAFIPVVGATAAGIVAALVALVGNGPVVALIVVAIVIAVNQLEGNLLQPLVMGGAVKLHPLVILLALTAGSVLAGVIGALLAVPIAAVTWTIITTWNMPEATRAPGG